MDIEYRPLDITVISAEGIKDVNTFSKMDVYAVVSITGDPKSKRKTHVDKDCGTSPKWNHRFNFTIDQASLSGSNPTLHFQLLSDRTFAGDKVIGDVSVPLRELLDKTSKDGGERVVEYQVRTPSGKPKGTIKFSYKFGGKLTQPAEAKKYVDEPVMAYPAPAHVGASSAYPPPSPGMGYAAPQPPHGMGYPPSGYGGYPAPPPRHAGGYPAPPPSHAGGYAPGYGYQPPPMGYGYPPVQQPQQPKKKNSKFGLGLGAGLLGGLLVGDMLSDVGEMASYDAGFDDGGFDF
ncbi:unnamed protein product [Ilex paraguariensis]|uniref:C2 domain-containing protein n=1 Tax=Ilex paraguariensis TaxID=185542 RepID=A0ABC8T881_9AQUA